MAIRFLNQLTWLIITFALHFESSAKELDFPIGVGDELSITVYNEPDLSVTATIGASKTIQLPLLGEVSVVGKTPNELAEELEARLFDGYLVNPNVLVKVVSYRSVYVRGAVNKAGSYDFEVGLTVEKAIAIAGGLKDRASSREWYVIREPDKERIKVDKDTLIMPGDIVEIKESLF